MVNTYSILVLMFLIYKLWSLILSTIKRKCFYNKLGKEIYRFDNNINQHITNITMILIALYSYFSLIKMSSLNQIKGRFLKGNYEYGIICYYSFYLIGIIIIVYLNTKNKSIMFESGILCPGGNILLWNDIKAISFKGGVNYNKKYIVITSKNNKKIYVVVREKLFQEIKENIFNKSGLICKDIILK